jgi:adenylylsulfate kinase
MTGRHTTTTTQAPTRGATIWLTGLSGAGKSTVAEAVADRLRAEGHAVQVLDGDELRAELSPGLGFTRQDRDIHVARVGYVARLLAGHGVKVLAPVIAPYAEARAAVAARHAESGVDYLEIHVATPVQVCAARDTKGLYAKQAAGEISGLTGVDDPYEPPPNPALRLDAHLESVQESAQALYAVLEARGLLGSGIGAEESVAAAF